MLRCKVPARLFFRNMFCKRNHDNRHNGSCSIFFLNRNSRLRKFVVRESERLGCRYVVIADRGTKHLFHTGKGRVGVPAEGAKEILGFRSINWKEDKFQLSVLISQFEWR